jgi:diguanylate cyclase (GGDEF)-like protein/PAS domain S-box-containing protein
MSAAPSESRFATIFALCPVGLALTAEDGLVVEANPALAQLLDLPKEEVIGRRLLEFTHPEDRSASSAVGQSVIDGDSGTATMDKRYISARGFEVPVRLTMIALEEQDAEAHKLIQVQDLSEQRKTEENLRRQAAEDPLTGLANRRALDREIAPLLTADPGWAVISVDLDDFKSINDVHGHHVGDAVLVTVASRLTRMTRAGDLVARLGGDEFVVLLGYGAKTEVLAAQTRIRRSLSRPMRVEGTVLRVSASVGHAIPREQDSASGLLARADAAMYENKRARTAGTGPTRE